MNILRMYFYAYFFKMFEPSSFLHKLFQWHKSSKYVSVLGEVGSGVSGTAVLDSQRADFGLLMAQIGRVPWEKKVPGRVPGIPQEGNLGGAEAGHPNIPKDKMTSKQTEQRSLAKNHDKKESLWPLQETAATQEKYKNVMRTGRGKIRRVKAHIELKLAAVMKTTKNDN